jgi:hypothetical protein
MEYINRLGPPQIKLAGLEVWIHHRSHFQDYWDGNWVNVTVRCYGPGAEVLASGSIIHLPEIERWLDEATLMRETLSGTANLACMEPGLSVELTASSLGHILMEVQITPDHMSQQHSFKFEIDQSYLGCLLTELRAVLAEYPIRGERPVVR